MAESLDRALADGWNEVKIEAECRLEGRLPRVEVFGNGVGIWNDERQFVLSRTEVRELLAAVRDAGFASMRPSYGGKHDPAREDAQAPRLTCRASVSLDGTSGEAVQLEGGRQSAELRLLAETILSVCREKAAAGTGAVDLDEGLAKVASGILAPEVLQVVVSRQPEGRSSTDPARVLTMRVAGCALLVQGPAAPLPQKARLAEGDAAALARLLREGGLPGLPANLYAEELTDLVVRVLGHEKAVQARRFAGMSRATHADAQARFDRLLGALDDWRQGFQ